MVENKEKTGGADGHGEATSGTELRDLHAQLDTLRQEHEALQTEITALEAANADVPELRRAKKKLLEAKDKIARLQDPLEELQGEPEGEPLGKLWQYVASIARRDEELARLAGEIRAAREANDRRAHRFLFEKQRALEAYRQRDAEAIIETLKLSLDRPAILHRAEALDELPHEIGRTTQEDGTNEVDNNKTAFDLSDESRPELKGDFPQLSADMRDAVAAAAEEAGMAPQTWMLAAFDRALEKGVGPKQKRRPQRAAGTRPDPERSRGSQVNLAVKPVSIMISPILLEAIDLAASVARLERSLWLSRMLQAHLDQGGDLPVPHGRDFGPQSQKTNVSLEPELLQAIDTKVENAPINRSEWIRRVASLSLPEREHHPSQNLD